MHIHGGNVEEITRRYGLREEKIMDFSANINPLGPSSRVIKALKENLSKIACYPDPEAIDLREKLSKCLKVNPENIIAGNGAEELIYLICRALKPGKALIIVPTFGEYEIALKNVGCKIEFFPVKSRDDFRLDIEELLENIKKIDLPRPCVQERGLLFLCNPNNPTGQLINKADMLKIVGVARKREVFVVVDEAFMDFDESAEAETLIQEAIKRNNLFVIRSLTKFFALPGIRIGYGIGNKRLLEKLKIHKEYWSVNTLAQIAGIAALKDKEYVKKTKELISEERKFLYHKLSKINGLRPYSSVTNFIFCQLTTNRVNSTIIWKKLIQKNILIRDCSSFRSLNNRYIRMTIKTHQENLHLINFLSKIL
ncbi:threonine-phosphate decarboxylase [bacterium]|nr:threonine-phosphate decarboxylase [bacterium]